MGGRDQHSRLFRDLCDLALGLLRSPAPPARGPPLRPSPAGLVSLMLGVSTTLMLSGSVAFAIGLLLMPWVIGTAAVLYVVGALWDLSAVGRSLIFPSGPPRAPAPVSPTVEGSGETLTRLDPFPFAVRFNRSVSAALRAGIADQFFRCYRP